MSMEKCQVCGNLVFTNDSRAKRLREENEKLRELVADMSKAFLTLDIDHCQACPRDKASRRCQMFVTTDAECAFVAEMRELGIEADDG